jgi:acetolactate synthase I/II/III large subunit
MLAGHLLVDCLIAQGATHAFGVPGESYLAVLDGLHRRPELKFINCRNEGGAAFMAEAHGKLTGRPGICMVTRGPGATNASIGVHTAFQDSTPMVLLVGDVASDMRDREAFQEVDFFRFFGPLAKRVERIDDARRIPEYIARAYATALNGRPGPVVLVLPEDMLMHEVDAKPRARIEPTEAWSDPGALRSLRTMLLASKSPLVLAGGGGWTQQSAAALQRFCENWQLPVANTFRFQDTFDNHHANYAGDLGIAPNPELAKAVRESDLLIAIGARLGEMTTSGYTLPGVEGSSQQRLVHIHSSAEELNRVYAANLAIQSTMNAAARSLEVLTAPPELPWQSRAQELHAKYVQWLVPNALPGYTAPEPRGPLDLAQVITSAQKLLGPTAVATNGAGNFAGWLHRFWRFPGLVRGLKTQLAPTNGAMGYGVPAGIAAAITTGRPVFTIAGDGDFQMNCQELATAQQYGAKVLIAIVNNGIYGTIRMHQEREFPGRVAGAGSGMATNPDFCALARAYGFHAQRVEKTADIDAALQAAVDAPGSAVVEFVVAPDVISSRMSLAKVRSDAEQRLLSK